MNEKLSQLKSLLLQGDAAFWPTLAHLTEHAQDFETLFLLSSLRKKAHARNLGAPTRHVKKEKIAIVGAYSLYPLHELIEHCNEMAARPCEVWLGAYDNYISEIVDETSDLYRAQPNVTVILPAAHRCRYAGPIADSREVQEAEAMHQTQLLLQLAQKVHSRTKGDVIMANFPLPPHHDLGPYRSRILGSEWTFQKWVNLQFGLQAPSFVQICDLEFLANRLGGLVAHDARGWFESKQLGSPAFTAVVAREISRLIVSLRTAPKKLLILDLDNTLWGGVVADDGLEGIEIGDTSPRGEAFKAFQHYIRSLKQRGILLAVCSKNDHARAAEPFEKHPEMVLRMDDFVAFRANWEPKAENIRQIASDLNVGLDSVVFVDDNPAEIEIARQFVPQVSTICLGPDPSEYVAQLQDCRLFEPLNITAEDSHRTAQYQTESKRKVLLESVTDMDAYLQSLEMIAEIHEFQLLDVPRLSQLINKSNQFNLTTRRRSESEVEALISAPSFVCYSVRLKDRFGDHGLISVVIAEQKDDLLTVDTWLMSCRVLKRQVEEAVLNELVRLAKLRKCTRLEGTYLPTPKNSMVRDFYTRMGFTLRTENDQVRIFDLDLKTFSPMESHIKIARRAYEPS